MNTNGIIARILVPQMLQVLDTPAIKQPSPSLSQARALHRLHEWRSVEQTHFKRVVCRAAGGVQGSVWCAGQRESRDNAQHLDNLLEARRQRMAEFAGGFSWATRVSVSVSVSVRARM